MTYVLGIDTSNYTTSVCLVDAQGNIVREERRLLQVEEGERGLQQSAALFQHVQNLPTLIEKIGKLPTGLAAVCVSTRPRRRDGSYMPVFTAGTGLGRSLAATFGVPLLETSHQEGHIAAGEGSTEVVPSEHFLAVHISGGTTDLLDVKRLADGYEIEELGTSIDLHAGQFVDRIGVALGLTFPAGPQLEQLAQQSTDESVTLPSPVNGYNLSFAGPETAALRLIQAGTHPADVARAVERCIAKGLEKTLRKAVEELGIKHLLIVGGVAANAYIRERLKHRLEHRAVKAKLYFALPRYSTDNAFGVARLGLTQLLYKRNS
ncbi:O-sialoglycoprotein endopeptidase [Tumebacillus permanentifrigoris]|uniref:N(6)-L-threonylcarbamoyladenine synthase n=1 Tax=Tumebacillus permanentifrigoris TaxID=378543 RepID=A0A316D7V8_9BACL|nr:O-sialoglycoprotein endopeptidase [Tumebacillus permanentifrigoris]PWK11511.1 N6-L-threonylcarbamoyladenine synthase [Tumebacillus permanentifrigoris]